MPRTTKHLAKRKRPSAPITDQDAFNQIAWRDFVLFAWNDSNLREAFTRETGVVLERVPQVNDVTRSTHVILTRFVEWVTLTQWGIDHAPSSYVATLKNSGVNLRPVPPQRPIRKVAPPPPESRICALCIKDLPAGPVTLRPLGPNHAMVSVCPTCDQEHPRSGRYGFGDSSGASKGIGEGNRRSKGVS